jgi:phenylalanyl-tRNA synthetase alpha subunit
MAKFNLEEVIKANTGEDGVINFEAIKKAIDNDYVNPIVASNKPNVDEIKAKAQSELFESLGIDGVKDSETLKKHITGLSDGKSEIEKTFNEFKTKTETEIGELRQTTSKAQKEKYFTLNKFNSKYEDVIHQKAESYIDEENKIGLKEAYVKVAEEYPEFLGKTDTMSGEVPIPEGTTEADQVNVMAAALGVAKK